MAVAYSGGPDSTALLWVVARQAQRFQGLRVLAFHVHHGLQPEADAWLDQARSVCDRLGVGLFDIRLSGRPGQGDSVEAWARRGRYEGLRQLAVAQGASLVLLAQHAEDQAETVLLQALRGGGPAGLAAMPREWSDQGVRFVRPWLDQRRAQLHAVAAHCGLPVVSDPSNADARFARSRLRMSVMPALEGAFPDAVRALGQVARQAAQAEGLAREAAAADLPGCVDAAGCLCHHAWSALPPARRRNVLRAWLQARLSDVPRSLLERLSSEWVGQGGVWPARSALVRSRRGRLTVQHSPATK